MTYSEGAYGRCDASVRCQGTREALSQTSCQEAGSFGPQAMGTADAESGVDLLVEYEPGRVPDLLGFLRLEEELRALFGVYSVGLVFMGVLSPFLRDAILRGVPSVRGDHAYSTHVRDSLHEVRTFVQDEVAEGLSQIYQEASYDHLCFWGRLPGPSHEQALKSMCLFASEVAPKVREAART
jgi:predicted nucleotidyltransferase